jgi:hypothetical protein
MSPAPSRKQGPRDFHHGLLDQDLFPPARMYELLHHVELVKPLRKSRLNGACLIERCHLCRR